MAWQSPYDSPYPNAGPDNPMNGFKDQSLDEDAFGPGPGSIVSAFDAFRMFCLFPQSQHDCGDLESNARLVSS